MLPHRVAYWNIGAERILIFPIAILALALLLYALRVHYRMWRIGQKEDRFDRPWERIKGLLLYGFANGRVVQETYPGIMHALLYGGMVVLFIGTVMDAAEYYLHLAVSVSYLQGPLYLVYSLALDIAAVAVLAGLSLAAYRRYVWKPDGLNNVTDDRVSLILLGTIVTSGLLVEGFRMAVSEVAQHPDWSIWSPLGYALALAINALGLPEGVQLTAHRILWSAHLLSAQSWIAYIFYSKLGHIFLAPLNIYFRNLKPSGALPLIPDMENAQTFGARTVRDLTWKQLLDLDACVGCGRCYNNCPASLTGKRLNPKRLIMGLKAQMVTAAGHQTGREDGVGPARPTAPPILDGISEEAIWQCMTCGACQDVCPVFVEHLDKVVQIRRNLVMVENRMPDDVRSVFTHIEKFGQPWIGTLNSNTTWMDELGIRSLEPGEKAELLYWVGCMGPSGSHRRKIVQVTAGLLQTTGVRFGVLGNDRGCCGDSARRLGNERLYRMLARQNIAVLASHGVRRIVTHCPHCFNTLKNEYPHFGGDFQVIHHSQLLAELVQQGRLRPRNALREHVVLQDACYLVRHNGIHDAPRNVLQSVPGINLVETKRSGRRGFCCGGGGGLLWVKDSTGRCVNDERIEQLRKTGASVLATSCPFCLQMLEDGLQTADHSEQLVVRDLSELLQDAIQSHTQGKAARTNQFVG